MRAGLVGRPRWWLGLLVVCAVAFALAGGVYRFALMAVHNADRTASRDGAVIDLGPSGRVVLASEAAARVGTLDQPMTVVRGHGAPLVSGKLSSAGGVITTDVDGHVRLTHVDATAMLRSALDGESLSQPAKRLWRNYGRHVAAFSLAMVSRLMTMAFHDCETCPEMIVVPSGSFMMGSQVQPVGSSGISADETPQRAVTIDAPFAVGRFEVTRAEFAAFVSATGHGTLANSKCRGQTEWLKRWVEFDDRGWRAPGFGQTDNHPVACVSWEQATAYARWLSQQTGYAYRLLTEAEWEYAARASTRARSELERAPGDFCGNADETDPLQGRCKDTYVHTAPVGSFKPNAFGLHDMRGNVEEWVQDCYMGTYEGAPTDGSSVRDQEGCARVVRGGAWTDRIADLRTSRRHALVPTSAYNNLGFRLARQLVRSVDDGTRPILR